MKHFLYFTLSIFALACFIYACALFGKFAFWSAVILAAFFLIIFGWKSLNLDE